MFCFYLVAAFLFHAVNCQNDYNSQCRIRPITPFYGNVKYSTESQYGPFPPGTTANLLCHNGYSSSGPTQLTCINGKFNPQHFGPCKSSGFNGSGKCGSLPEVANGKLDYFGASPNNNLYALGTPVNLMCNLGYVPKGPSVATCTSSGWSSPVLGPCLEHRNGWNS